METKWFKIIHYLVNHFSCRVLNSHAESVHIINLAEHTSALLIIGLAFLTTPAHRIACDVLFILFHLSIGIFVRFVFLFGSRNNFLCFIGTARRTHLHSKCAGFLLPCHGITFFITIHGYFWIIHLLFLQFVFLRKLINYIRCIFFLFVLKKNLVFFLFIPIRYFYVLCFFLDFNLFYTIWFGNITKLIRAAVRLFSNCLNGI